MPTPLSSARRSELRALAHSLSPVVLIGDKGLTDAVVMEVDRALKAHELIKVRASTDDRKARSQWLADLCARLDAHPVQAIGKVLVLWRENPKEEKAPAPKKPAARARKEPVSERRLTRSGHRQSRTPSPRPASEPRRRRPKTSR